jgi:hypothetical protein
VRVLTISDSIYRELQRRAGASGVTMTAYLQTLLERDGAGPAAAPTIAARPPSPAGARADVGGPPGDAEPSIADLFAHVRALQAVEVPDESDDAVEEESGQRER